MEPAFLPTRPPRQVTIPAMGGTPPTEVEAVRPERAVVVPRVRLAGDKGGAGGDPLPAEDRVHALLRRGVRGLVSLSGPPGSGKTATLRHLKAVLPPDAPVRLYDDISTSAAWRELGLAAKSNLVICAARPACAAPSVARLEMARWGDDDLIEYLLARHRPHCQAVMMKVKSFAIHFSLDGSPELWRIVLDTMAADPSISDVPSALRRCVGPLLSDPRMEAGAAALACLQSDGQIWPTKQMIGWSEAERLPALLRHRAVQVLLASERIVARLCDGVGWSDLEDKLPHDLILETARLAAHWPAAVDRLTALVAGKKQRVHPMAVSVLLAARPEWRPGNANIPTLSGAYIAGAHWAGVDLHGGRMVGARLDHADLSRADLHNACAMSIDLRQATLRGACLTGLSASGAQLAGADLVSANAAGAKLANADLHGADLRSACLKGADLTGADLSQAVLTSADLRETLLVGTELAGADLVGADLACAVLERVDLTDVNLSGTSFSCTAFKDCDMEEISLPKGNFAGAKLTGCYLTGARMPGADFRDADLRNTGLADIDWEGADLREADLRGASFHLGSTRSGLVGSAVPCEGSKTGFYTDDFQDREFKTPEEIRKANLCGADLRGARVAGVDFYLVDIRRARYTPAQAEHFRRCGAIMDDARE